MFPPAARSVHAVLAACLAVLLGGVVSCNRSEPESRATTAPDVSPAQPGSAGEDEDGRPLVVCLGDSLTAGYGLVESQSYPSVLQRKIDEEDLGFRVMNAGVSGDTSAGGLRRLEWALQGEARVLVVALGGNDALRGLSVNEMRDNLSTIVERAQSRGVVVVLAGMQAPPNFGPEYTTAFRQAFVEVAARHRTPLIPFLLAGVAGEASLNQADGIHPNARGAEIVAATVWQALRPILQQLSTTQ